MAVELWAVAHPTATSVLAYPEGRAAIASARRSGRLGPTSYRDALTDFEALQHELVTIGVDGELAREAGGLAAEFGLRGYDAVHLASALALGSRTTLVSWDRELARAAARMGLGIAPPP